MPLLVLPSPCVSVRSAAATSVVARAMTIAPADVRAAAGTTVSMTANAHAIAVGRATDVGGGVTRTTVCVIRPYERLHASPHTCVQTVRKLLLVRT